MDLSVFGELLLRTSLRVARHASPSQHPPISNTHPHLHMQYARILQKLENPVIFKEFKIQNMVGSCDVRFPIRLEGLASSHSVFCSVSGTAGVG